MQSILHHRLIAWQAAGRCCGRLLQGLGVERAAGLKEPEDHAGVVCEIMAGLTGGYDSQAPRSMRVRNFLYRIALGSMDPTHVRRT